MGCSMLLWAALCMQPQAHTLQVCNMAMQMRCCRKPHDAAPAQPAFTGSVCMHEQAHSCTWADKVEELHACVMGQMNSAGGVRPPALEGAL